MYAYMVNDGLLSWGKSFIRGRYIRAALCTYIQVLDKISPGLMDGEALQAEVKKFRPIISMSDYVCVCVCVFEGGKDIGTEDRRIVC